MLTIKEIDKKKKAELLAATEKIVHTIEAVEVESLAGKEIPIPLWLQKITRRKNIMVLTTKTTTVARIKQKVQPKLHRMKRMKMARRTTNGCMKKIKQRISRSQSSHKQKQTR